MKTCEVCHLENDGDAETCVGCGEASWVMGVYSRPIAPGVTEQVRSATNPNDAPKAKRR